MTESTQSSVLCVEDVHNLHQRLTTRLALQRIRPWPPATTRHASKGLVAELGVRKLAERSAACLQVKSLLIEILIAL